MNRNTVKSIFTNLTYLALLLQITVANHVLAISENSEIVIGLSSRPSTVDPHYENIQPAFNLSWQVYEPLIGINQYTGEIENILANSVELIAPGVWKISIQKNIHFHDNSSLTIDDVIYSIYRLKNHPNASEISIPMNHYARGIINIEKKSPYSMEIHTDKENTNILSGLSRIFITKKPIDIASADKESFDSGKNAIGTGPYSFGGYNQDNDIILNRFEGFHGELPYFKHGRLCFIADKQERIKAFLKGEINLLEKITIGEATHINKDNNYNIAKTNTHRLIFLNVNNQMATNEIQDKKTGKPLSDNPFSKLKVRQALSIGIDRKGLLDHVLQGSGKVASQYVLPQVSSYSPAIKEQAYQPDMARQLLAEAGYPNGFKLPIYGPNDRYMNDADILDALAAMLKKIGIEAIPYSQPKSVFFAEAPQHEFMLRGYSTNGQELDMLNILVRSMNEAGGFGTRNFSGYSNPEVDDLLERADSELSPAVQRNYIRQATEISLHDLAIIPLYFEPSIWIMTKDIEYWHNPNERTLLQHIKPAE